jgi:hypothetical protein
VRLSLAQSRECQRIARRAAVVDVCRSIVKRKTHGQRGSVSSRGEGGREKAEIEGDEGLRDETLCWGREGVRRQAISRLTLTRLRRAALFSHPLDCCGRQLQRSGCRIRRPSNDH